MKKDNKKANDGRIIGRFYRGHSSATRVHMVNKKVQKMAIERRFIVCLIKYHSQNMNMNQSKII